MWVQLRTACLMLLVMSVLTGLAYPLAITGIVAVICPHQAEGSLVQRAGKPVGSALIGQPFDAPQYFWSRPSATGPFPYNAASSSGSNLAVSNPVQRDALHARVEKLRAADVSADAAIPGDLVTASGSGLDPHISPAAAAVQVARVAKARGLTTEAVQRLVKGATEGRQLGLLGEPRVNVLRLNLALDEAQRVEGRVP